MPKPQVEVETQMKQWGCPYALGDPKAVIWLEGYRKGIKDGTDMAKETMHEVFDAMGKSNGG